MFFNNDEDDSDFLSPTGGSKLANLFGVNQSMSQGGNESLTYTAPKEPKKKKADEGQATASANAPTLLHALAAQTYKFVDGKSVSQGKLGVALLGNHAEADYKILVYRTKQEQITHVSVTPSFKLSVHANNYASFYDDQRQGWSLMFESEQALATFAKEVGLAVAGSAAGKIDNTISQDLVVGEGGELEVGDSAEVRYTGWLFKNNALGDVYDSNTTADKLFRLKLGKGKAIKGWEDGMIGMKKGGKRLLIIPPSLGYGAKGNGTEVPPNSTLAIEFEIVRVKFAKDKDTASIADSVASNNSDINANPPLSEDSVKARTKSIDEQLNKGAVPVDIKKDKSDKARLISRMAKMGQAMLPGMNAANQEVNPEADSEEEDSQGSETAHSASAHPSSRKPPIGAKPHAKSQPSHPIEAHPDLGQTMQQPAFDPMTGQPIMPGTHPWAPPIQMQHQQPYPMSHSPMVSQPPSSAVFQGVPMPSQLALYQNPMQPGYPQMYHQPPQYAAAAGTAPIPPVSTVSTTPSELPVLLSESRQQNTEIRLTLSRMADKVDNIHSKIDGLHQMGSMTPMAAPAMETTVLLQNIQRIVAENEHLKKEVFERSARIEAQNEKINDLLQRNQKYVEQSNSMLEQRNDAYKTTATQSQHKVLTLEQEKVRLANELSSTTSELGNLQLELNSCKKNEAELAKQLDSAVTVSKQQLEELNSLRERLKGYEQQAEEQSSTVKEEKLLKKKAESELSNVREELNDLKVSHEALEKNFNEKRQKYTTEVKKLEEELEELKQQHETEVTSLKEKLRRQKTSTDVAAAEQVTQLEKELEAEWKEKCDRLLANANERNQRSLKELKEEKEQLEAKLADLENKMSQAKAAKVADEKAKQELQGQVDDLQVWKEKYELLRKQAGDMKQRYEDRLAEVEEERDAMERQRDVAMQRAREAMAAAASGGGGGSSQNVTEEVKKIMNTVYKQLKAQFDASKSYPGNDIHKAILQTVKEVTLSMVQQQEEDEDEDEDDSKDAEAKETEDVQTGKGTNAESAITRTESSVQNVAPPAPKTAPRRSLKSKDGKEGKRLSKTSQDRENRRSQRSIEISSESNDTDDTLGERPPKLPSDSDDEASDGDVTNIRGDLQSKSQGHFQAGAHNDGWITASEDVFSDGEEDSGKIKESKVIQNLHGSLPQAVAKPNTTNEKDSLDQNVVKVKENTSNVSSQPSTNTQPTKSSQPQPLVQKIEQEPTSSTVLPEKSTKPTSAGPVQEEMMVSTSANLSTAPPGAKPGKPHDDPEKAKVLGDKGNPYYLEELKKTAEHIEKVGAQKKQDVQSAIEGLIISSEAAITGDKGNVHYGEEISKGHKDDKSKDKSKDKGAAGKEEVMVVQSANLQSAGKAAPSKDQKDSKSGKDKDQKDQKGSGKSEGAALKDIEASIMASTAAITGDKGNVHYGEELRKAAEHKKVEAEKHAQSVQSAVEDLIMSSEASITGDKGNVHYGKELEKGAKAPGKDDKSKKDSKEKIEKVDTRLDSSQPQMCVKEEVMTRASAPSQSHGKPPSKGDIEDKITAVTASITGDRGNVHYGEEIRKAGKDKSKEDITKSIEDSIMPVTASITGDKGNIYYGAEIRGEKIHEEKKEMPKKSASDILGDIESSIITGSVIPSDDKKSSQKASGKAGGASGKAGGDKKQEKASADILSSIESSIIQDDYLIGGVEKKSDPLAGSKVVSKDAAKATKATKAETPGSKKGTKASSLFDDDDDKDLFGGEPFKKSAKKSDPKSDKKSSDKKPASKKTNSDSEEDWRPKPPPPPLFGDDEDDEDLDWLN